MTGACSSPQDVIAYFALTTRDVLWKRFWRMAVVVREELVSLWKAESIKHTFLKPTPRGCLKQRKQ